MVNNKIANLTVLNLTIARHEFERDRSIRTQDKQKIYLPGIGQYSLILWDRTQDRDLKKKKTGKMVIFYLKNLKICRIVHF